jgi:hypothetical protein
MRGEGRLRGRSRNFGGNRRFLFRSLRARGIAEKGLAREIGVPLETLLSRFDRFSHYPVLLFSHPRPTSKILARNSLEGTQQERMNRDVAKRDSGYG